MAPRGSGTMRLTIQVLPLAEEDARGAHTSRALEFFKGRRFALPVKANDSFAAVWQQIEQRHVENYLDAQQAAMFSIKKLQDAYDCDLDLRDTVASIFGAETDPAMRTIKVVPAFVGRDFSVPATTHLRPAHAQKRTRPHGREPANKRQRVGQPRNEHHQSHYSQDQPLPSTEHSPEEDAAQRNSHGATSAPRSRTADSLVFMHDAQTGYAEFASEIKQEQPEASSLSMPPPTDSQTDMGRVQSYTNGIGLRDRPGVAASPNHVPETRIEHEQEDEDEGEHEPDFLQRFKKTPKTKTTYGRPPRHAAKRKDLYDISTSPEASRPMAPIVPSPRKSSTVQSETALLKATRLQLTPAGSTSKGRGQPPEDAAVQPANQVQANEGSEPLEEDLLRLMKLSALRDLAKSRGLNSAGQTRTLIKRLLDDDRHQEVASSIKAKTSKKAAHLNRALPNYSKLDQKKNTSIGNAEEPPAPAELSGTLSAALDAHQPAEPDSDSGSDLVPARKPDANSRSRSGSAAILTSPEQQKDVDMDDDEQKIQAQLNGHPQSAPESSDDPAHAAGSRSPSADPVASNRSSPAVSRRPALYLSHSPSHDGSGGESESNEIETEKSLAPPTQPENEAEEIDSENDPSSSESATDDEGEVEEISKAPNASATVESTSASQELPSSPPNFPTNASQASLPPQSAQPPISASQPVVGRTLVPVPSNIPQSSQTVSTRAAAIRPKLAGRRSDFPSLSELVADTKKPATPVVQKSGFDPRSMSLNKLAGKVLKGTWGNGDEQSSEDEEESSDSS